MLDRVSLMFNFSTTKSLVCGVGSSRSIPDLCAKLGSKRPLIVTDEGLMKLGLLDFMSSSVSSTTIFSGVTPDPTEENVKDALEVARMQGCDGVVGFGGGSSLDVAKVVAYLASSPSTDTPDFKSMYGVDRLVGSRLPLIQVPTTAGTGSEVTPISILTNASKLKQGVVSPTLLPDYAVLDGNLTLTVPPATTAHTGVDAMVHAIEAYTTAIKKNPLSDMFALEALRILTSNIDACVTSGASSPSARNEMLYGSALAGMAFANAPVGGVHALAYPLGGMFGVPHGLSCSLMLPAVMEFNAGEGECAEMYVRIGREMFPGSGVDTAEGVVEEAAKKCCALEAKEHYWGQDVRDPVVAITTGVTSRNVKPADMHVGRMALFTKLLPSIIYTYDCDIEYLLVIAYDKGDAFYDTDAGKDEMNKWLTENMAKPMAEAGVRTNFLYVQVDNVLKKPGPVFNAMLKEAYIAGADYFYRLNDDTELKIGQGEGEHHWAKAFIGALSSLGPPYGVAGPMHNTGNTKILTHDFVHRTHMDIFKGVYYDPIFTDWWMDDYISHLYGRSRTLKSTHYPATHHTSTHGRRYEVDENKGGKVPNSVKAGRAKIAGWMREHGWGEKEVQEFVDSKSGKPYRDFPCGDFTAIPC